MASQREGFEAWAARAAAHFDRLLAERRDSEFEKALHRAFLLYTYVFDDCTARATKNKDVLAKTGVMLIEVQDALRGLLQGMTTLSPVILSMLLRVVIEIRCNLRFILTRKDPLVYADRFFRYGRFSAVAHDETNPGRRRLVTPAERDKILRESSEWITTRPNGTLKFRFNWTGDPQFATLKQIAKEAGLEDRYVSAYSATSQIVHCTVLATNHYSNDGLFGPVGDTRFCKRLASLAALDAMFTIREAADFFGLPYDKDEFQGGATGILAACRDLDLPPPPAP